MLKPAFKHCDLGIFALTAIYDRWAVYLERLVPRSPAQTRHTKHTSTGSVIVTFFIDAFSVARISCFRVPGSKRGSRSWRGRFLVLRPAKPFRIHSEMNFVLEAVVLALGQQFKIIGDRGAQRVDPLPFGF